MMNRRTLLAGAAALPMASLLRPRRAAAAAAISDGVVKIGVLDDMSGVFTDQQGMGDYVRRAGRRHRRGRRRLRQHRQADG
jgi:branched-chain amino acid transport system substrate-binding protein